MATDPTHNPHQGADLAAATKIAATLDKADAEKIGMPAPPRNAAPAQALVMRGPMGEAVRLQVAREQAGQDHAVNVAARARNFADKRPSSFVISKENVAEQTKGLLSQEFAKDKGGDRGR